jgi:hypothetical protein
MGIKRISSVRSRGAGAGPLALGPSTLGPPGPPALGDVMAELCSIPTPSVLKLGSIPSPSALPNIPKLVRSRRAGPFKVPVRIAGPPNIEREALARRFKQHLRGVSGANKLGPDPDEHVPPSRPGQPRAPRPGFGYRPNPMSRFGRPTFMSSDDDEDE